MGSVEIPEARVVSSALQLGPAPRRIPLGLWVGALFGSVTPQLMWWVLAVVGGAMVLMNVTSEPEKQNFVLPLGVVGGTLALMSPLLFLFARKRLRALEVLRHGAVTRARLTDKWTRTAPKSVFTCYRFTYTTLDGSERTTVIELEGTGSRTLEDEDSEAIIYDPADRYPATTLDHLAGSPTVATASSSCAAGRT